MVRNGNVSRQQAVQSECATLTIIVGAQDNESVFYSDDEGQRPDDDGQGADEVDPGGLARKSRGVDIERTGSDVTVDDTSSCEQVLVSFGKSL